MPAGKGECQTRNIRDYNDDEKPIKALDEGWILILKIVPKI